MFKNIEEHSVKGCASLMLSLIVSSMAIQIKIILKKYSATYLQSSRK